jgi:voltage-gated potassium channel
VVVLAIPVVLGSSLMYYVEHTLQPDTFPHVPAAIWWAIIARTTVGYGDVHPISTAGKIVGAFVALMGIGLVALPAAILSSGFLRELQRRYRRSTHICPHCGATFKEQH